MKWLRITKVFLLTLSLLFANETFAETTYATETRAKVTYAEETSAKITYAEMTFANEVIASSGLNFRDKNVEKMTARDLKDRYGDKYPIDWGTVIAKLGAGTAIIVITGTVSVIAGAYGAEPVAAIAYASCEGAITGAISGAAIGGGLGGLIEGLKNGDLSAAKKGAVEGAADGFMWGAAIGAVTGGWSKFKSIKNNPSVVAKTIEQGSRSPETIPKGRFKVKGYVDNGVTYVGDDLHRVKSFSVDDLKLTNANPRNAVEPKIGKEMQCGVGGHLIANRFGGTGGYENLVSMSNSANKAFSELENIWAKSLKEGKKVSVSGDVRYIGDTRVPTEFFIEYVINEISESVRIPNLCP